MPNSPLLGQIVPVVAVSLCRASFGGAGAT
jgi:hypothetical protein